MKDKTPESRLGVYQTIDDIPTHHRIASESNPDDFKDRDVWHEYWTDDSPGRKRQTYDAITSQRQKASVANWTEFTEEERDVHHALAEPEDVIKYADLLVNERELAPTTIKGYWGDLLRFYDWLKWHTEFPHRYNSVLVASASDSTARTAFDYYVTYYSNL